MFRPYSAGKKKSSLELNEFVCILRNDQAFCIFGSVKVKFEKSSFRFSHCSLCVAGVVLCPSYRMQTTKTENDRHMFFE